MHAHYLRPAGSHDEATGAITGDAKVSFKFTPRGIRSAELKHGVTLHGWPAAIPFASPSALSSLDHLGFLLREWRSGGIRFRRMSADEEEEAVSTGQMPRVTRCDQGQKRQHRDDPALRGKRRPPKLIKSSVNVPDGFDDQ